MCWLEYFTRKFDYSAAVSFLARSTLHEAKRTLSTNFLEFGGIPSLVAFSYALQIVVKHNYYTPN